MADVTIKLQAATKEFVDALEKSNKPIEALLKQLTALAAAQAKAAEAERKAAAASRAAASERTAAAKKRAEERKQEREDEKEAKAFGKSMLAEADRMKRLFEGSQEDKQKIIDDKKKADKAALEFGKEMLAESDRMTKLFYENQKKLSEKDKEDKRKADKEKIEFGKSMLAEADRMTKLFYENQKKLADKDKEDKKKADKEKLDFGKSMLAEADRMKKLFLESEKQKEKDAAEHKKKLLADERTAQRKLTQDALANQREQLQATKEQANRIALLTNAYQVLLRVAQAVFRGLSQAASSTVKNLDEFQRGTIATAIAITNLADPTLKFGKTWENIFQRNLEFTRGVFIELERVAARYFASAGDLQLAFNTLSQRGVVLRREELDQLGQLTDMILLLTGGQQSSIQIQEELRSLLNGSVRATAQLSNVIKAYGLDVKQVAAEIRATQSLKPLEPILVGAKAANKEVQGTFQATVNALEVAFKQIQRIAGQGFFTGLTKSVERLTKFINENREAFVRFGAVLGQLTGKGIEVLLNFFEKFTTVAGSQEAMKPIITAIATLQAGFSILIDLGEVLLRVLLEIPNAIIGITKALQDTGPEATKAQESWTSLFGFGKVVHESPLDSMLKSVSGGLFGIVKASQLAFEGLKELVNVLPEGKSKKVAEALTVVGDNMKKAFSQLDTTSFLDRLKKNQKDMEDAVKKGTAGISTLTGDSSKGPAPTTPPFVESDESIAATKKLNAELESMRIRAARATLALDAFAARAKTDLNLQKLRRDFALLEQGFEVLESGAVKGINSIEGEFSKLTAENAANVQRGYIQMGGSLEKFSNDMEAVRSRMADVQRTIQDSLFSNLLKQSEEASRGFGAFVQEVLKDAEELRVEMTSGGLLNAKNLEEDAKSELKSTKDAIALSIGIAEQKLKMLQQSQDKAGRAELQGVLKSSAESMKALKAEEAVLMDSLAKLEKQAYAAKVPIDEFLKSTDYKLTADALDNIRGKIAEQKRIGEDAGAALAATSKTVGSLIEKAQAALDALRSNEFSQLNNAKKQYDIKIKQAELEKEIANAQTVKINADAQLRITERQNQLLENQVRILQQIQDLQGKAFRLAGVEAQGFVTQQKVAAEAAAPRTEIQQRFAPIAQAAQQLESFIGQIDGSIQSLLGSRGVLEAQQQVAEVKKQELIGKSIALSGEQQVAAQKQLEMLTLEMIARQGQIESLNIAVPQLVQMRDEIAKTGQEAIKMQELRASLVDVTAGMKNAVDGITSGLTRALTDSFEGKKTDFKQMMKGVADQLFQDGMKPLFDKLKKSLSDGLEKAFEGMDKSMASSLGPAVMAGIGLIASFVIGQLMGDNGGEATANNPTVGIQSTEQVRGLIGGETQIPIGQIGESLQDALVPTNSILLRIARAVEGQVAGLSPSQIEDVIGRAVGDALQIQGA